MEIHVPVEIKGLPEFDDPIVVLEIMVNIPIYGYIYGCMIRSIEPNTYKVNIIYELLCSLYK